MVIDFDVNEDNLHSIFASLTGIGFIAFAVIAGCIEQEMMRKLFSFAIAFLAGILSFLNFFQRKSLVFDDTIEIIK